KKGEPVTDDANRVTIRDLALKLEHAGKTLTLDLRLALPSEAKGKVPVLVQSTFGFRKGGAPSGRRFATFTGRGYAVAELSFNQVATDRKDRARSGGVYDLFPDATDCGALMAWAWGVSRVIDALETIPEIDATKVMVTGHSRYGKAALVAGAFDERIALTVPSHSGCAGVAPFRFIYGKAEQLHNIAGAFPHWFRPGFDQFAGKVERLPVDQHLLLALVAPRPDEHRGDAGRLDQPGGRPVVAPGRPEGVPLPERRGEAQHPLPPRRAHPQHRRPPGLRGLRVLRQAAARGVRRAAVQGGDEGILVGRAEVTGEGRRESDRRDEVPLRRRRRCGLFRNCTARKYIDVKSEGLNEGEMQAPGPARPRTGIDWQSFFLPEGLH
ncbi:MAG TPA: hypothetical protein VIL46_08605, partial [Gemmataceae bacterium]